MMFRASNEPTMARWNCDLHPAEPFDLEPWAYGAFNDVDGVRGRLLT